MSQIKFPSSSFVGKQELTSLQYFFVDNGYKKVLGGISKTPGIMGLPMENGTGQELQSFKVSVDFTTNTLTIPRNSLAIDKNLNLLMYSHLTQNDVYTLSEIPTSGVYVKVKYKSSILEDGFVVVSNDGTLTLNSLPSDGRGFNSLLRGVPNNPTRIELFKNVDGRYDTPTSSVGEFEVVTVQSDTSCVITGRGTFSGLEGAYLKYAVVGTFEPGIPAITKDKYIYQYDSCEVFLDTTQEIPTEEIGTTFLLASIKPNELTDLRTSFHTLR